MFPDLKDGADIRMIQSGSGTRFAMKAFQRIAVARQRFGKKLQSNVSTEFEVFALVYDTHTPATELFEDAVVRDGLADHGRSRPCGLILGCGLGRVNACQPTLSRAVRLNLRPGRFRARLFTEIFPLRVPAARDCGSPISML